MTAMSVERVVGASVRRNRERLGKSQTEIGYLVGVVTASKTWAAQTVSALEKGDRSFAVAELVLLAHTLETTVVDLLTPAPGVDEIALGLGKLPRGQFEALVAHIATGEEAERLRSAMSLLVASADGTAAARAQLASAEDASKRAAQIISTAAEVERRRQAQEAKDARAEETAEAASDRLGE